jgi:hypothetical protein
MALYEVEATRWYFSEVFYRVVAKDESDALQRVHNMESDVIEISATDPQWNGEEEILLANEITTASLKAGGVQLPLWPLSKTWNGET